MWLNSDIQKIMDSDMLLIFPTQSLRPHLIISNNVTSPKMNIKQLLTINLKPRTWSECQETTWQYYATNCLEQAKHYLQ